MKSKRINLKNVIAVWVDLAVVSKDEMPQLQFLLSCFSVWYNMAYFEYYSLPLQRYSDPKEVCFRTLSNIDDGAFLEKLSAGINR